MNTIERLIAYGALALILVIGVPWYFEHRGAKECKAADAAVVAKAEVHNTQVESTQKADDKKAGDTLDASLNSPLGPLPALPASMSIPPSPSTMSCPRSNSSSRPSAPLVRAEPAPSVVQPRWDTFERSDVQSAHDADAEIIYLHTLLDSQYKLCDGVSK